MEINYRVADEKDALGFETVAAYSWKDTYWNMLPHAKLEGRIARLDNKEEIQNKVESTANFIKSHYGNIFVATDNDKVVGILEIGNGMGDYSEFGHLGAIYLLPSYKGNGIGKELLKVGLKRLIDLGYDKMQLECMDGNPTIGFYQKYGGNIVETITERIYDTDIKLNIVLFDDLNKIYKGLMGKTFK